MVQMLEFVVFAGGTRFGNRLAPFHLFDEKIGRHQGIVLAADVVRRQMQQVFRPRQRLLERLVGFIDPRRPLQRQPSLGFAGTGKAIRMNLSTASRDSVGRAVPHPAGRQAAVEQEK
jgi:hypothetical protein